MQITCLLENTASGDSLRCEHGLSLYIETEQHKILFDMGQTDMFADNAEKLGIDLAQTDIAILSHGHYDHGGGLRRFLEINKKAPVYLSRHAFEPHYNGTEKYIGLDTSLQDNTRLIFTGEETVIDSSLALYSCSERTRRHNHGSFGLSMKQNGNLLPDDFRHEQYLLIAENGKRILFSGCSHKGIMDIVGWFTPDVLIGGFHYSKLPLDASLEEHAKFLNSFDTDYYTCHCTGTDQFAFMQKHMSRLHYLSTGMSLTI